MQEDRDVRILLADDQPKVRSALRVLLGQQPDIEVVGETADAERLLLLVKGTRPDLVILDWELPGLASNGRLSTLYTLCPSLKVIALSGRPEARRSALAAGVNAFVSKVDSPVRLLAALQAVSQEI